MARTPKPPYYAVIFTSLRSEGDRGYGYMAQRMEELADQQPGFLGIESARTTDGLGILFLTGKASRPSRPGKHTPITGSLRKPASKFGIPTTTSG